MVPAEWSTIRTKEELEKLKSAFYDHTVNKCTCDECPEVLQCCLAYDDYNISGDCLLSK